MSGITKLGRLKAVLKRVLLRIPGGRRLLAWYQSLRFYRHMRVLPWARNVFTRYYQRNRWGDAESVSGPGSTARYTENIRKEIPRLIQELGVRRLLDAPCGDYNWFRLIPRGEQIAYIGGDIVGEMVRRNQALYGSANTSFMQLDITRDRLPPADLWLCRDVLFHLSERDVFRALRNFLDSGIAYLLTSSHPECTENRDIPTGAFRLLNLELPPYNFSKPTASIDDWIEGYPVRTLCLWDKEAVRRSLASSSNGDRRARPPVSRTG